MLTAAPSTVSDNFEALCRPAPWLTARPVWRARRALVDGLMAFHRAHRATRLNSVAHRINVMRMSDEAWEANPDYYKTELLQALGLLPTASTLAVWLVRHLLADETARARVVAEVRRLRRRGDDGRLDLGDAGAACPQLMAAWYETMRLHMTLVPRVAQRDFVLSGPWDVAVRRDDVLLLPMLAFNLDAAVWGPDAAVFAPRRFIDAATGALRTAQAARVRGFGVAGNLCPGRRLGVDVAVGAVAELLRDHDIEGVAPSAAGFAPPTALPRVNIGFERVADDVRVRLVRREA